MTKMNAFLRGVSPTVCRNLQFWNTAFNFDFYIQLIPAHTWLSIQLLPEGQY